MRHKRPVKNLKKWEPVVKHVPDAKAELSTGVIISVPYHAYAVCEDGREELHGRYIKMIDAKSSAKELAMVYNEYGHPDD